MGALRLELTNLQVSAPTVWALKPPSQKLVSPVMESKVSGWKAVYT